jgi:biopolymer transport protein ExbD
MAVFTHMSIIEFSLPPNVGASMANSSEKPQPRLTVRIGNDFLGIAIGDKLLDSLPVISHNFPFDTLGSRLKVHKTQMNYNDEIVVASLDNIAFKYVVRVMDLCREAGFPSVGLSSAVENTGVGL